MMGRHGGERRGLPGARPPRGGGRCCCRCPKNRATAVCRGSSARAKGAARRSAHRVELAHAPPAAVVDDQRAVVAGGRQERAAAVPADVVDGRGLLGEGRRAGGRRRQGWAGREGTGKRGSDRRAPGAAAEAGTGRRRARGGGRRSPAALRTAAAIFSTCGRAPPPSPSTPTRLDSRLCSICSLRTSVSEAPPLPPHRGSGRPRRRPRGCPASLASSRESILPLEGIGERLGSVQQHPGAGAVNRGSNGSWGGS
jgi:hypothetical protein